MEKVRNISDLRLMFHRNERPIYFISATNTHLRKQRSRNLDPSFHSDVPGPD